MSACAAERRRLRPGPALASLVTVWVLFAPGVLAAPPALDLACTAPGPAAQGVHVAQLQSGSPPALRLLFATRPARLIAGEHFGLDIQLCGAPGTGLPERLRVDADMPAHRHGMNYRASVRHLGQGRFAAEGLMFHMSGRWRYVFEVDGVVGPGPGQGSDKSVLAFDFLTEVE